jgi:hypothetical protein
MQIVERKLYLAPIAESRCGALITKLRRAFMSRNNIWSVAWAVVAITPFGLSTTAHAIEGIYRVEGHAPRSSDVYKGEAQIKKTGDTYTVVWRIGSSGHIGTGILMDNVLSVFFQPLDRGAAAGVACFRIIDDKIAQGTWTMLGGKEVGEENWTLDRGL